MSGLLLSLDVRIAYVDATGALTGGYIGLVNPVNVTIENPEPEAITRVSRQRDSYGQALDQVLRPNPPTVTLGTDESGDAEVLAWAYNGTVSAYSQSSETVSAAEFAVVKGKWNKLPHRMVSSFVAEPTGGGAAYAAGTDYMLDAISGMVYIPPTSTIATGDIEVDYTAPALTGDEIKGGTRSQISVRIDGEGTNLATGNPVHIVIPRAVLSASGGTNLVGDEFHSFELTGTAIKLTGQDPYTIRLINPPA